MQLHDHGESITSYDELVNALRTAVQVELGVLPPYFTAMYSIRDQGSPEFRLMRGVLMEEMLHLALNCNLLNAIGSAPLIQPPYTPNYPLPLPHYHQGFEVHLSPLTREFARDTLMVIERPSWTVHDSHDAAPAQASGWETLGQFYKGIIDGFITVHKQKPDLFAHAARQYGTNGIYSNGGGYLKAVGSLRDAIIAIEENLIQTQGTKGKEYQPCGPDGAMELSHFDNFREIADGNIPIGEVYPMLPDIKAHQLSGPLKALSGLFDDCWRLFLDALNETFSNPFNYSIYFTQSMWLMKKVFPELAVLLMSSPIDPNQPQLGNAGPAFYCDPNAKTRSISEVLGDAVLVMSMTDRPEWKKAVGSTIETLEYMMVERRRIEERSDYSHAAESSAA
ncbi:MAG: hypothetical protein COS82_10965 [Zetaproteobacteria bacterium CG06_land_8_20_14_3_00_59_53]|nr:MAG: hypothetical protein AUK36_09320 [Zetaproteobacteria bacterium CG2_30_59_37]PIO90030.1 MAG: hypothetical protein COX56_04165 [Zetaproteobacteria bacterium CG23_combo_of_CG06-09_8_20_14_all_59_86]PIQ64999.1 MAG: hypothetical protein COV97_06310 [Zetaproteobacteria bacterium CG11_big_fil_rev_8_21_14_0_20_59_439]PIU69432.1 MAG: hypothetical protein COS82_10965 [Zetaproteobacteria bacterium CG06_land_8_20_14_3_00_59_53]PIU96817.1 MAG: hypothetical protein COS62_07435 [Zetaproteobacteria bac